MNVDSLEQAARDPRFSHLSDAELVALALDRAKDQYDTAARAGLLVPMLNAAEAALARLGAELAALARERDELGPFFVRDMARIAGLADDASMDAIYAALTAREA